MRHKKHKGGWRIDIFFYYLKGATKSRTYLHVWLKVETSSSVLNFLLRAVKEADKELKTRRRTGVSRSVYKTDKTHVE